jgi:DNA-binding MarR family transcriptional regulator
VSDIGDHLGITSAASSQLLNRLVEEGWVERSEDPDDRRHKLLELTPAGREMVRESMEIRQSWLVGLADTLSPAEQAEVEKSINLLLGKVDQMEDDRIHEGEA